MSTIEKVKSIMVALLPVNKSETELEYKQTQDNAYGNAKYKIGATQRYNVSKNKQKTHLYNPRSQEAEACLGHREFQARVMQGNPVSKNHNN